MGGIARLSTVACLAANGSGASLKHMQTENLFTAIPEALHDELAQPLLTAERLRIERIVSTGQASPEGFWYDQDEHEWIAVLRGSAGLEIEGEAQVRHLSAGDYLLIPAHQRHRVAWTNADEQTVWLAVFFR